MKDLNGV